MLIDARELPADTVVSTEVCIVGSGPAGIALAREFMGQNRQVCLLESGGLGVEPEAQRLSEATTIGDPYLSPQVTRHRQLGGNSNVWAIKIGNQQIGVRYAPLDAIDFEPRDWIPYSGWPFSKSHLEPFYERAQAICQAGPYTYEADYWESPTVSRLPLNPERFKTTMFQFGPRAVFSYYHEQLSRADNVRVYTNATVVNIEANDAVTTATRVEVACSPEKHFWVEAKVFILATGGMENARLLLLSNRQQSAGLGNQYDVVGRFFMDHPMVDGGMFTPADPDLFNRMALYDLRRVDNHPVLGKLTLDPRFMQQEKLLNLSVTLFPRPSLRQFQAIVATKLLATSLLSKQMPPNAWQQVAQMLGGLDYVALASYLALAKNQSLLHGFGRGGWAELPQNQRRFKTFQLFFFTEQVPDPANRIQLGSERDALGCQKLELHWRWGAIDRQNVVRAQDFLAEDIARSGLGTYQPQRLEGNVPDLCTPSGLAHHMGATRMHLNPRQGVVDENCRVHGLSNLYVAGSSVFPTGGYANPTLTIVALSLRLADHLKQVLQSDAVGISEFQV